MQSKILSIALLFAAFTGCDYEFKNTPQAENNANNASNQNRSVESTPVANSNASNSSVSTNSGDVSEDAKLVISSTSENTTIPCGGREVEFTSDATANNIKFTGECKKIVVDGVSNKITVEKVGEISVKGVSNQVLYEEGVDGKKPKITKIGKSALVDTIKSAAEKEKLEEN